MTLPPDNLPTLHAQWLSIQPLPVENNTALWQWIRMNFNHLSNNFEGTRCRLSH